MDYESEIDHLESVLSNLESTVGELQDVPYFEHLKGAYEDDMAEIQQRLDELYELQNEEYDTEMRQLNREYEGSRL
jgi:hypothetical protein